MSEMLLCFCLENEKKSYNILVLFPPLKQRHQHGRRPGQLEPLVQRAVQRRCRFERRLVRLGGCV